MRIAGVEQESGRRWQTDDMTTDLQSLIDLMPFAGELGLVLREASPDRVIAELDWSPRLCTSGGVLHGGALMTLADTAGALVAFLGLPPGSMTATMTSTTQMFRPVSAGTVRAEALALHRGRSTVTEQTSVRDAGDRLVAQTTQIQAIRPVPAG
jgi:1,4-dihydroxy-2-naphthoyl-CoA hydrolase